MNGRATTKSRSHRSGRLAQQLDGRWLAAHAQEAALLLRALANPHRLVILSVLSEGERCVGELNRRVPLSQSALSQHLSVLRHEQLVQTRRESQTIYYRLVEGPALDVLRVLQRHERRA